MIPSRHLQVVPREDDLLVERCRRGDRQAFDALYLRHVDFVHKCLVGMVGSQAPLEDLTQTVFLEAFRSLHNFKGKAAFRTWLYRVMANIAYQHLRRRKPEMRDDDALTSPTPSPEEEVDDREALSRALTYLQRLKPKQRIAFVLRVVEDLSLKEIGAIVGASVPTVGARVREAEKKLQALAAREQTNAAHRSSS
ncbi:RNA polymerase sigma factor [Myxococcota bacterium]